MKKTSILCVGIGGYANTYLSSVLKQENPDFEIVGMVEVAPERCPFYPQLRDMGVPLYASMEDFYREKTADLAIITTPIHLHTRQILCALENGSNVMCEKPLSGVSADEQLIAVKSEETGKFVIIGYQWSYSQAITDLKEDIMQGLYGAPLFLKSLILWPRGNSYFTRGTGWAGKRTLADGTVVNDSVASNATAHYIHNMLYVTGGAVGKSSEVVSLQADLVRLNKIENFDTLTARMELDNGAKAIYIASHATRDNVDPVLEYRFEKGTVTYGNGQTDIIGTFADGTVKNYGDPYLNTNNKVYEAIAQARGESFTPRCGVKAAAAQVRCIEKLQENPIRDFRQEYVRTKEDFLYVEGLDALLLKCFEEEKLLSEYPEYSQMVK